MKQLYAKVAVSGVTYWVDRPYEYSVPQMLSGTLRPGIRVSVPFSRSNRKTEAVVLEVSDSCQAEKTKFIDRALDEEPQLEKWQLELAMWMRERFFCTVYEAVHAMLPAGLWFESSGKRRVGDKLMEYARLAVPGDEACALAAAKKSRAPMQAALLELISAVGEASSADLRELTGASEQSLKALEKAGAVELFRKEVFRRPKLRVGARAALPELNGAQEKVFSGLCGLMMKDKAAAALLFGVTGSGKTSVYVHLIDRALAAGRGVILLVPEIALTPQMVETFSSFFGDGIAVLHSSLSLSERCDEYKRIKKGDARLVIGTRSAVFAPVSSLGLIIMDEEHEDRYKSENSPRYHARDIAKYRCAKNGALLLLGSATPDIVSAYCARQGKYSYFELPERYNRMALPRVHIVDMKRELRSGNDSSISSFLRQELQTNIENREQSILFINRRGASKLITCVDCGYSFRCPNCSVSLTYHSSSRRLMCHYCGFIRSVPSACPDCGGELSYIGDGTQKIESTLNELFPDVGVLRMDTDTVAQAGSHDEILSRFRDEHIPILVGTQMVTKGLNFDDVTLVGVISADQSLYCGDYRAAEKTFSLITQVVGRSGRASRPGRAVIQTFTPENQVIRYAARQDYRSFFNHELELRQVQKCPPFSRIIAISINGADERAVLNCAGCIRSLLDRELRGRPMTSILGPAPYPVVRVNNRYRYRISLLSDAGREVRALVSRLLIYCNTDKRFRGTAVYADMDPAD